MTVESAYPLITVPPIDLWTFLFERRDREYPDEHVIYVDTTSQNRLTFRDIQHSAEQFGRGLRQQWNWHKGDVLALFTPNSADVAAATFGTLWAGGVLCPPNNLYKVGELVSQLESSGAKALVTHATCLEVAQEAALIVGLPLDRVLVLGGSDPKGRYQHFSHLRSTFAGIEKASINPRDDLAFLVYSSGTTGLPKGVMLTHENMIANIIQSSATENELMNFGSDRSIGFLPMFHIYGIAVLVLYPIYRGITAYIMQRFDLQAFCQTVQREKITFAYIVPPVALTLAKHPLVDSFDLSSLRMMHSSAAPIAINLIETIYRRLKVPVKQGYGLSEASPSVALQSWSDWNKSIGSCGRPIPSLSMKFVLDGREVPTGEEGEILVRGPNVFKGYYNNPKATAQSIDQDGWYHTGDIGYADKDNNIYITDRVKELIKYNGFQVAPAQLESLLLAHPAVNDVAVIGVYSEERATELPRAYIVLASDHKAAEKMEEELSDWLNEKVAPYKRLRGGIRFVNEIPKSNAGKLLRRTLVEQARMEQQQKAPKARL